MNMEQPELNLMMIINTKSNNNQELTTEATEIDSEVFVNLYENAIVVLMFG